MTFLTCSNNFTWNERKCMVFWINLVHISFASWSLLQYLTVLLEFNNNKRLFHSFGRTYKIVISDLKDFQAKLLDSMSFIIFWIFIEKKTIFHLLNGNHPLQISKFSDLKAIKTQMMMKTLSKIMSSLVQILISSL